MSLNSFKGVRTNCHLFFSASPRRMLLVCGDGYFPSIQHPDVLHSRWIAAS